jgi:hypothetical protein
MRRRCCAFKKQWIGRKASNKTLIRYCREIWSELVKTNYSNECFLCHSTKNLQAHHLITKKWNQTAFLSNNGVALCKDCHMLNITSAHSSPWILEEQLKKHKKYIYDWFLKERKLISNKNNATINYKLELEKLLLEFEKKSPVKIERSKYFKFSEAEEFKIVEEFNKDKHTCASLGNKFKASNGCIREILLRHGITQSELAKRKLDNTKIVCSKKVYKLDLNGNKLELFNSISEAAIAMGAKVTSIHNCISGRSKTSSGFKWILAGTE